MRLDRFVGSIFVFASISVLSPGCNRNELNLAPVEGVVTFNGAPLADAGVLFSPNRPQMGPPASGTTDAEGRFTLITVNSPGAAIGDHRVAISKEETITIPQKRGFPLYQTKRYIPEKYADPATSELTAAVQDDDNSFEFKLEGPK
jgi:hypothetical protein